MTYGLSKIRDNRSEGKAFYDYKRAQQNEEKVMSALLGEFLAKGYGIENTYYEKIDQSESFNDNRIHLTPDYYFYYDKRQLTFEIKVSTTGNFLNGTIYIKPSSIITMNIKRDVYPNGNLIIACPRRYAVIKSNLVADYPIEVVEEWSNNEVKKKAFCIPELSIQWRSWLTQLDL